VTVGTARSGDAVSVEREVAQLRAEISGLRAEVTAQTTVLQELKQLVVVSMANRGDASPPVGVSTFAAQAQQPVSSTPHITEIPPGVDAGAAAGATPELVAAEQPAAGASGVSAATATAAAAAAATVSPSSLVGASVFVSCRFPSVQDGGESEPGALKEMMYVRASLEARGVEVLPLEDPGNVDRQQDIFDSIDRCDLFIVFGTRTYGEDTGNPMCSYNEFTFAQAEHKAVAWIKMCDVIASPTIRAGLSGSGAIYKIWEETPAMIDFIANKIPDQDRRTSVSQKEKIFKRQKQRRADRVAMNRKVEMLERQLADQKTLAAARFTPSLVKNVRAEKVVGVLGQLRVTWDASRSSSGDMITYVVRAEPTFGDGEWALDDELRCVVDGAATDGSPHVFTVVAKTAAGFESAPSAPSVAAAACSIADKTPAQVLNVQAQKIVGSLGKIKVDWSASRAPCGDEATSYAVRVDPPLSGGAVWTVTRVRGRPSSTFDGAATDGSAHTFTVVAKTAAGYESALSAPSVAAAACSIADKTPAQVLNVRAEASPGGPGQLKVDWDEALAPCGETAARYKVVASPPLGGGDQVVDAATTCVFDDAPTDGSAVHTFTVVALAAAGFEGPMSAPSVAAAAWNADDTQEPNVGWAAANKGRRLPPHKHTGRWVRRAPRVQLHSAPPRGGQRRATTATPRRSYAGGARVTGGARAFAPLRPLRARRARSVSLSTALTPLSLSLSLSPPRLVSPS
jgi:hypothetical protein